ncbi:3-carboxy-cis,cis-muconate cycloisomerase [Hoeflea sp.]|uniref:3-carboxy-cis,cis-muconate cycloisomerase n=1 Tax=Hoeflea sp. TaxID=1940281 RepID=UPI002AFE1145|nr:3-carboxy-cis,cis-muconate cycloisomerase [Hoeflea sp.]
MTMGGQGWVAGLIGDEQIASQFGDAAQFASFARFEQALIAGLAEAGRIELPDASRLISLIESFEPDRKKIALAAVRDGVPIPDYVRQLRAHVSGIGSDLIHHGATSQDLLDTATVEALARITDLLSERLDTLLDNLAALEARDGANTLQAVTRMQPALDFHVGDRLAGWRRPLEQLRDRLPDLRHQTEILQFGGAVGNLQALGADAETVANTVAHKLGLRWPGHGWHSARGPFVHYAGWLCELSGALGKIGQDVALMALRGESDIRLSGGGASSAMPHKHNPIAAERLVALACFNATQISAMHQAQIHEMERSGAAWMLEWMVLPQICEATGAGLVTASGLLQSIQRLGTPS